MKYNIKPNQSRIFRVADVAIKDIRAIVIDVEKRQVREQQVRNSLSYLRENFNFFNCVWQLFKEGNKDCFIIGVEEDLKTKKPYQLKGYPNPIYGNSVLIKFNGDEENLQSTKVELSCVIEMVDFGD